MRRNGPVSRSRRTQKDLDLDLTWHAGMRSQFCTRPASRGGLCGRPVGPGGRSLLREEDR